MSKKVTTTHAPLHFVATSLDEAGAGVGLAGGFQLHVEGLLPGERALVRVDHVGSDRKEAWGRIVEVRGEPSAARVEPACPAFGRCGGCAWQHLDLAAARTEKRRHVVEALAGILPPDVLVAEVRAAPSPLGYRNKAKFVVARGGRDGKGFALGAYAPRTHDLVETIGCQVIERVLGEVARDVRALLNTSNLTPYNEKSRSGHVRYVILRSGEGGDVVLIIVTSTGAPPHVLDALWDKLIELPHVGGVLCVKSDDHGDALIPAAPTLVRGQATVRETLGGVPVDTQAAAFFQVNREQARALYHFVAQACGASAQTRALDLYCGAGGVAFALAAHGATVLGMELDARAVESANLAVQRADLAGRARFRVADVAALSAQDIEALRAETSPNVVVVNPPRKGLTAPVREALGALAAETIVYVSCSPTSLARDLLDLRLRGYQARSVTPFDLMPGTGQVETVVVLRRG